MVAGKENAVRLVPEAELAGGVTGRGQAGEPAAARLQHSAGFQCAVAAGGDGGQSAGGVGPVLCQQLRRKALRDIKGIEIVKVNDAGDTTAATDNMSAALQANDDLVGLFCVDGIAGTAGPTAVAESGKDLRVLAFDVDTTVLDKVKNGEIDATVAQGMYNMGFWSMMFLYTEANGLSAKALPQNVDTGVTIVTKENVDEYYPK